jgi:hypothetical protein
MTIDDLIAAVERTSPDPVVQGLAKLLASWKTDDTNVEQLIDDVERYVGNTWVQRDSDHEKMYGLWRAFRQEVAEQVGGMTMNERLYLFGLLSAFDAASSIERQDRLYAKLLARR